MVDQAASNDAAADHDDLGVVFQDGLNSLCHRQADLSRGHHDPAVSDPEGITGDDFLPIVVARIGALPAPVNAPPAKIYGKSSI